MTDDASAKIDRQGGSRGRRAPGPAPEAVGPARDFASFCELERERRRNADDDFDPERFDEALALVLAKLGGTGA
jgi:hypothetical protein